MWLLPVFLSEYRKSQDHDHVKDPGRHGLKLWGMESRIRI